MFLAGVRSAKTGLFLVPKREGTILRARKGRATAKRPVIL